MDRRRVIAWWQQQTSDLPETVRAHGVGNRLAPPLAADGTAATGGAAAMRPSSRNSEPIPNALTNVLRPDAGRRVTAEQHGLIRLEEARRDCSSTNSACQRWAWCHTILLFKWWLLRWFKVANRRKFGY